MFFPIISLPPCADCIAEDFTVKIGADNRKKISAPNAASVVRGAWCGAAVGYGAAAGCSTAAVSLFRRKDDK